MRIDPETKRSFLSAEPTAWSAPPGLELLCQGEPVRSVYSLERGLCKVVWRRPGAKASLIGLRGPGSLVGAESALAGANAAHSVITLTTCSVTEVEAEGFRELVRTNPELSWQLHRRQSRELVAETTRVAELAGCAARERLLRFLEQARNGAFGLAGDPNALRPRRLPLKQKEIAEYLGIATQHLSALLRSLEAEGLTIPEAGVRRRRRFGQNGLGTNGDEPGSAPAP
jgi:CRP-like cAMP-binding protein